MKRVVISVMALAMIATALHGFPRKVLYEEFWADW